ncbi:MAG: hypothetical protein ABI885_29685, partial [Gammaproteobacteria bacterium]
MRRLVTNHTLFLGLALTGLSFTLASCVDAPPRRVVHRPAAAPASQPPPPPISTQVYVYPTANQSEDQQSRDRYECYLWSVKQSNFDPSQRSLAPHQRVEVVPMPASGSNTAAG